MSEQALRLIAENKKTRSTTLDLGNCGLTDLNDVPELFELEWLEELNVSNAQGGSGDANKLGEIPAAIGKLKNLQTLIYCGDDPDKWEVTSLAPLANLKALQLLNVGHSTLSSLAGLEKLSNLIWFSAPYAAFEDLDGIGALKNLYVLDLSGNPIKDLKPLKTRRDLFQLNLYELEHCLSFEPIKYLKELRTLGISRLRREDFVIFRHLQKLQELVVRESGHENSFSRHVKRQSEQDGFDTHYLEDLSFLINLEKLDIDWPELDSLKYFHQCSKLKTLSVHQNCITDISSIRHLNALNSLRIEICRPEARGFDELRHLTNLVGLSFYNYFGQYDLKDISWVANLKALNVLGLKGAKVEDISPLQAMSEQLVYLDLSNTEVYDLSPLSGMKALKYLHLKSAKKVSDISPLASLSQLEFLNLSYTSTSEVASLAPLKKLKKIILDNTQVADIEPLAGFIEADFKVEIEHKYEYVNEFLEAGGRYIFLCEVPLTSPPVEVVNKGNAAMLAWFRERQKPQFKNTEIKLILMGNSTSGKTSLTHCLRTGQYQPPPSTHGIRHELWQPEGRDLVVHCWDFGGQEYYHATHRLFLSRNAVYALVWDAETNAGGMVETQVHYPGDERPVWEILEHYPYQWWLGNIHHFTGGSMTPVPVFLIQNKAERDGPQRISGEVATKFGLRDAWLDHQLSLEKMGSEARWQRKFEDFTEHLLEALEQQITRHEFAEYHRDIREEVRRLAAARRQHMPLEEFEALCLRIAPDYELELVFIYLRDITGDVLYYPNNSRLALKVFLNPAWVCDRIYQVLSRKVRQENGLFKLDWVCEALRCEEPEALDFIALMRELDLIFDDSAPAGQPASHQYVAPQYLPERCPNPERLSGAKEYANLSHGFTLWFPDFLPKSHLARFIARRGHAAEQRLFWKNGLLFKAHGCTALVEQDADQRQIRVEVQAAHPQRGQVLQRISQWFQELEDGQPSFAISVDGVHFVQWKEIEDAIRAKAQMVKTHPLPGQNPSYIKTEFFKNYTKMEIGKRPLRIFISYARAQREYFEVFKNDFSQYAKMLGAETEVFTDEEIPLGTAWDEYLQSKVAECDVMLLLVSQEFMNSGYIQEKEFGEAIRRLKSGHELLIVPIYFAPCRFQDDAELSRLQFFKPHGEAHGCADKGDRFSYIDLVEFRRTDGQPIPNSNRAHYMKDLMERVKEGLEGGMW